jgi:hypothetical protein
MCFGDSKCMLTVVVLLVLQFGCGSDIAVHTMGPTEVDQVCSIVSFPLPVTSSNVYYYESVGGMQSLRRFVRFDAPSEDIKDAVIAIVSNNSVRYGLPFTYTQQPYDRKQDYSILAVTLGVKWWTTTNILNGYTIGEVGGYAVQLWIDRDRNRVYLLQTD